MAFFFGMSQPQACVWAHRLFPILEGALRTKLALPVRKAYNLEKTLAEFPSLTFIVDGTERPVRRPKHGIRRKALYSGRKKRHAVKNIIAVRDRRVVLLGKTRPGSWHDKKCIDRERWTFPHGSNVLADSGFEAIPNRVQRFFCRSESRTAENTLKETRCSTGASPSDE